MLNTTLKYLKQLKAIKDSSSGAFSHNLTGLIFNGDTYKALTKENLNFLQKEDPTIDDAIEYLEFSIEEEKQRKQRIKIKERHVNITIGGKPLVGMADAMNMIDGTNKEQKKL